MPRTIAFTLAKPTMLLNETLRTHHRVMARKQVALAWEIASQVTRPAEPFARARVRIERRSTGTPDQDGAVGGAKSLIDCLLPASKRHPRGLGIIADDGPGCITLEVVAVKVKRDAQRTVVVVEEMP